MSSSFSLNRDYNSDDEEPDFHRGTGREATILVIDCSELMLKPEEEDGSSKFTTALKVLENLMLNKIVQTSKDSVSFNDLASAKA